MDRDLLERIERLEMLAAGELRREASAGVAGLMRAPVSRLVYVASADLANGLAVAATTWTDIVPSQSFTLGSRTGFLYVSVRVAIGIANGGVASEFACRALIDGASAVPLSGDSAVASGLANLGGGMFRDTGRAPGSHTIKIQVYGQAAFTAYCRAASNPNEEFAAITIDEHYG
jgi:hypothetical protein